MESSSRSMFMTAPGAWMLLGVLALSACGLNAQGQEKIKYLAIFTSNVNVDGKSYKKGYQMEALGYDRVSRKVKVKDQGKAVEIPAATVKVLSEDEAGISIVDATYTAPNANPRSVASRLQRKYDGQQEVSFVVAGSDFGVRSTSPSMPTPPSGSGPSGGGGKMPGQSGGSMGQGGPGGSSMMTQPATLEVTYFYKGASRTVSAAEGQAIRMP